MVCLNHVGVISGNDRLQQYLPSNTLIPINPRSLQSLGLAINDDFVCWPSRSDYEAYVPYGRFGRGPYLSICLFTN